MTLRKLPLGQLVNASQYNELVDAIKAAGNVTVRGKGVRSSVGPHGTKITIDQVAGAGGIGGSNNNRRAQMTEAASGTSATANLLNSEGDEIVDEITVNFFKNVDNKEPAIANDEIIPVYKDINGEWYCPYYFHTVETITVQTSYSIDTGTSKFKKTTRANTVVFSADSTSQSDVHTGDACP